MSSLSLYIKMMWGVLIPVHNKYLQECIFHLIVVFCSELFLLNHNFQLIFCKKVNIFSKNSNKFFLLNNTCSITLALNICQCRPVCAKRMKISCRSLCRINLVACGRGTLTHLLKLKLVGQPSPCFTPLVN